MAHDDPYTSFRTRKTRTPQHKKILGREDEMVANHAGGYTFTVSDADRLDRFLIMGSESTYYVNAHDLTAENAQHILTMIKNNGGAVVQRIVDISTGGRAPSNDPALFALALCASHGDLETRRAALAALPQVARIGTHLFHFIKYVRQFRGWGRALRNAVAAWYTQADASKLAYQTVKYRQRDGWSHRDVLSLSHPTPPTPAHNAIFRWITQGVLPDIDGEAAQSLDLIRAYEAAKVAESKRDVISLIAEHHLTHEMIPTRFLSSPAVWEALLEKMPLHAMVRNLGKMSSIGLLTPLSDATRLVTSRLSDTSHIRRSRLHPMSILVAMRTYANGYGRRGHLQWSPVAPIIDALDGAFYLAFGNVVPSNKRQMIALDVSGSMSINTISGLPITPREASAALALITMNAEKAVWPTAFSSGDSPLGGIRTLDISPRQRLNDVLVATGNFTFGETDCALPMLYARERKVSVDAFVVITDNETWSGTIHPIEALRGYREESGINAKLIVVGMTSTNFSIADPQDPLSLDVVGFDTATPAVISDFIADRHA